MLCGSIFILCLYFIIRYHSLHWYQYAKQQPNYCCIQYIHASQGSCGSSKTMKVYTVQKDYTKISHGPQKVLKSFGFFSLKTAFCLNHQSFTCKYSLCKCIHLFVFYLSIDQSVISGLVGLVHTLSSLHASSKINNRTMKSPKKVLKFCFVKRGRTLDRRTVTCLCKYATFGNHCRQLYSTPLTISITFVLLSK